MSAFLKSVVFLLVFLATTTASAIDNGVPPPDKDRRFDAVGVVFEFVNGQPVPHGSCVLIGPNVAMTAAHVVPVPSSPVFEVGVNDPVVNRVRFRRSVDGLVEGAFPSSTSSYQEFDVYRYEKLVKTGPTDIGDYRNDLALIYLRTSLDDSGNYTPVPMIKPLAISTYFTAAAPLLHSEPTPLSFWLAGWGRVGPCFRQGTWELRYARMSNNTGFGDTLSTPQFAGSNFIAWPYTETRSQALTGQETCNGLTTPLYFPVTPGGSPPATLVNGEYFISTSVGLQTEWDSLPRGNEHDSGGGVLAEFASSNGGEPELRLIGIISTARSATAASSWSRMRWNYRMENDVADIIVESATTGVSPCRWDFDRNGIRDIADTYKFIELWNAGSILADLDNDNDVNVSDVPIFNTWNYSPQCN